MSEKRAQVFAVNNRKGGVGKSTMTDNLSQALAAYGFRVGVVDTDSQGHASLLLNMTTDQPDVDNALYATLVSGRPVAETVREVPSTQYAVEGRTPGGLYLMSSGERTYRIPYEIERNAVFALLETIEEMAETFALDAILIDTSPTLNLFDAWVYMAADYYLFVTECEQMSLEGLRTATEQITKVAPQRKKYLNRDTRLAGVIPNKFRPNTRAHRDNMAALGDVPGMAAILWPPVRLRTRWADANEERQPIYRYAPHGDETADLMALASRFEAVLRG